jgi:hypothetical protein
MVKGLWLASYGFESFGRQVKIIRDKWTIPDIIKEPLCFTKA